MDVTHSLKYKLAVLVFKALHGLAPQYLADDCQLVTAAGRRQLRSSDALTCVIQRTRTRLGDRSFAVAGPRLCNSLPAELHHPTISLRQFRLALKTHLFLNWDRRLVTLAFSAPYKCSYLLTYSECQQSATPRIASGGHTDFVTYTFLAIACDNRQHNYGQCFQQSTYLTRICAAEMAVRYAALSACRKVHP